MNFDNFPPPIYEACRKKFGVNFDDGIIFAYGNVIHSKELPSEDLVVHEKVHMKRQKELGGPEIWWAKYLEDDKFRLEEEVLAYRAQYAYLKKLIKDRNALFRALDHIGRDLSGTMYGKMTDYWTAIKLISNEK